MATVIESPSAREAQLPPDWSLADLQLHLGGIPAERIRLHPPPGSAGEEDVVRIEEQEHRLFELIDGILVEKTVGWYESELAALIVYYIHSFLADHDLGKVLGADGAVKLFPKVIRIPDISFIRWERIPKRKLPRRPVPPLVPNLAVEVLSQSSTEAEMDRKLRDFFDSGVELVWYIDPEKRSARIYTAVDRVTELNEDGVLDGGDVLPGFKLSLRELFARADRQGPAQPQDAGPNPAE